MKRGLLLGAGFSVDFAMPLVWELTLEMRRLIPGSKFVEFNKNWIIQGNGFSEKSVSLFLSAYEDTSIHYEQIVGRLEVLADRFENRSERENLLGIKIWLMELIYYLLYPRQIGNIDYNESTIRMYRGFKNLLKDDYPLWVFSLNHDLMIECLAGENNIPIRNGFFESKLIKLSANLEGRAAIFFKTLDLKDIEETGFNFYNKKGDYGINLLKIHGSLDIFGYNDLKSYLCLHIENPGLRTISEALKEINEVIIPDNNFKVNNEIVMRDESGEIQFLRRSLLSGVFKFKEKSSQIIPPHFLKSFKQNINACDEIVSIGYSFGDWHVNDVLKNWLETGSKKTLRIVCPQKPILDFMGHLKSQIFFECKTSIEFFSSLEGGELTKKERLLHALRDQIRKHPTMAESLKKISKGYSK